MSSSASSLAVDSDAEVYLRPGNIVIEGKRQTNVLMEQGDVRDMSEACSEGAVANETQVHSTNPGADEATGVDERNRAERVRDDFFISPRYYPTDEEVNRVRRDLFHTAYNVDRDHTQLRNEELIRNRGYISHNSNGSSDEDRERFRRHILGLNREQHRPGEGRCPPSDLLVARSLIDVSIPQSQIRLSPRLAGRPGAQMLNDADVGKSGEAGNPFQTDKSLNR